MGYQTNLVRCNITATLPDNEVMVNTVWIRADQESLLAIPGSLQTICDRVRDKWQTMITVGEGTNGGLRGFFGTGTQWTRVDAYRVNALGKATAQAQATFSTDTSGNAGGRAPGQLALVVTTKSSRPGRSGRGRLYLGGLATANINTAGRLSTAQRDGIAKALRDFYIGIRDTANAGDAYRPVIVSPTLTDSFKITSVEVGDVFDTMRSRRNALVEAKKSEIVDAS